MIRDYLTTNNTYKSKISYIVLEKKDKAVQTEECLALKIGDQIVSKGGLDQPLSVCKGTAESTTWWHNLLRWN